MPASAALSENVNPDPVVVSNDELNALDAPLEIDRASRTINMQAVGFIH